MKGELRHKCMRDALHLHSVRSSRRQCGASRRPNAFVLRATTMRFFDGTAVRACCKTILVFVKRMSPKYSTRMIARRSEFSPMLPQSTRQPVRRATLGLERCHIRGGWHAVQWHIHQHRVTTGGGYERISLGPVWKLSTAGSAWAASLLVAAQNRSGPRGRSVVMSP